MDFYDVVGQVLELLQRQKRVSYRALKRQFSIDDDYIEDLKEELIYAQQVARDEDNRVLVWTGDTDAVEPTSAPTNPEPTAAQTTEPERAPASYTPSYLAEKILTGKTSLEGERKVVTVLFADIKDSTELIRDLDPEDAQKLLDPAIHIMMEAVHRFEGTVNQVLGDGIMSIFGAPITHEDHAARACYAALAMQSAMRDYTDEVRRRQGLELRIRVGLNSGEVVVRTIGNDLHMDYSAVGPTTHLAARMEQLANPGSIRLSASTLRLVEWLVQVNDLGPIPIKGMDEPVAVYELIGASSVRRRLQAAVSRGLTKFVGRDTEIDALSQALQHAGSGHGQIVAAVGEAGVGKSRLIYEFVHSHRTQGWLVLESASVSYGKATPYFPVIDLLKRYVHVEDGDDVRTIRAKVTGQILTLDESLQETIPALLSLLDALPDDSPFLKLDPPQRRQRTLDGLKRILLRESQVQPLLLVFEDLHWHDSESQALLDSLVESLPTAQLLLLVNYRPEYAHNWGSKTYYTQLRLDPLPPESSDEFLEVLLGDDTSLEPLKKLLIERTEGNPFFLEESVRTLVETQVLVGEHVLLPLGEHERICNHLHIAETLARTLDDQRRLGQVFAYQSEYFRMTGDAVRAVTSGERALALARTLEDFPRQILATFFLGTGYYSLGEYRRAADCFRSNVTSLPEERLRERFGMTGFPTVMSRTWLVSCLVELGEFDEGIVAGNTAIVLAELTEHPFSMTQAYNALGTLLLHQGDLCQALPVLERSLALCQTAAILAWFPTIAAALGYAYVLSGRIPDALPLLQQAVVQDTSTGITPGHARRVAYLSKAYLLAGHMDEATDLARSALAFARTLMARGYEAYALWLFGERHLLQEPLTAESHYQQALILANELGMRPLQAHCHRGLGTLYSQTGQAEQARTELSTAIEMYRDMEMTFWLPETEAALAAVEGR